MSAHNRQPHESVRLPLSLSIIFGAFTLGFYVAIQGPTLLDLIELLHVNHDTMSHSMALSSIAYSIGGLLSGLLFEYVDRQVLIPAYYVCFGISNILTPYITNYYVFSVITMFKMMCAGGTDCGANVWILDMWPGKDAWLQALHFSFAVGCALGPLVVEPFLSAGEHKDPEGSLNFKDGHAVLNENTESRIHIPYAVSGSMSVLAALIIVWLFFIERKHKRQDHEKLQLSLLSNTKQPLAVTGQAAAGVAGAATSPNGANCCGGGGGGEQMPLSCIVIPQSASSILSEPEPDTKLSDQQSIVISGDGGGALVGVSCDKLSEALTINVAEPIVDEEAEEAEEEVPLNVEALEAGLAAKAATVASDGEQQPAGGQVATIDTTTTTTRPVKFSSKAREYTDGRPPYYVMFAITITAMCLSFYCGIEITSMNYLATFAVSIDLQLPKSTAALMSSALTISFAVGRLFGIWIAAYMRPHKLFYLCAAVMALGNVFILLFANTTELLLWASICLFGIGCGPMYASIVSFYDDKIAKVTNTVSGIFILGSMFNVALNTVIIGHYIIDNALILIVCNLMCAALLLCIFGSLHLLTKVKMHQRKRKFLVQETKKLQQQQQQQQQHQHQLLQRSQLLLQQSPPAPQAPQLEPQAQVQAHHLHLAVKDQQHQEHLQQQQQHTKIE